MGVEQSFSLLLSTAGPGGHVGDTRFTPYYERVAQAADRASALRHLRDEEVVAALAAASAVGDRLLANVLATEAQNRMRRARAALLHLGEGVLSVDGEERVTFANPAAARMLGRPERDLAGIPLHDLHGPGGHAPDEEPCCVARALRARAVVHCERESLLRGDGAAFPVAYTVAPLLRDGEVEGAVLVFGDITSRKREERAMLEWAERWRSLADAASEAVVVHDGRRILHANLACARMLGLRREDVLGRDLLDFVAPGSRAAVSAAIASGSGEPCRLECLRPDGATFWVEARARRGEGEDGRRSSAVTMRKVEQA